MTYFYPTAAKPKKRVMCLTYLAFLCFLKQIWINYTSLPWMGRYIRLSGARVSLHDRHHIHIKRNGGFPMPNRGVYVFLSFKTIEWGTYQNEVFLLVIATIIRLTSGRNFHLNGNLGGIIPSRADTSTSFFLPFVSGWTGHGWRLITVLPNFSRVMRMLEVCVDSLESAINAIHGGADELEVCSSLAEGGLTPSLGLVKKVQSLVAATANGQPIRKSCRDCGCKKLKRKAKVNVMIRCRAGSDFVYSAEEMETMLADMEIFKEILVDRYVFGALTETRKIDEILCDKIVSYAYPTPVTFHRAFDLCANPTESLTKIKNLGFDRLLTSGQKATAADPEAIDLLKVLYQAEGRDIAIMPGGGVNLTNARSFIDMGFRWVHSSCKRIRNTNPEIKSELKFGSSDREPVYVTDENTVRMMKNLISETVINLT